MWRSLLIVATPYEAKGGACVWCVSFMCGMCLIHVSDVSHSCVWCVSFMCVMCLIYVCDVSHNYVCYAARDYVTHACVYHDSFMCTMTRSCVCHDSFMCVPWRIPMRLVHVTHRLWRTVCTYNGGASVWRDSISCLPWLIPMCVASLMFLGCISMWNLFHVQMHHRNHRRRRLDWK